MLRALIRKKMNLMTKFTPGPWRYLENWETFGEIVDTNGFPIADVFSICIKHDWRKENVRYWNEAPGKTFIERSNEELEANKRLIAAAPELYEALKEVYHLLENYMPTWYTTRYYRLITNALNKTGEGGGL